MLRYLSHSSRAPIFVPCFSFSVQSFDDSIRMFSRFFTTERKVAQTKEFNKKEFEGNTFDKKKEHLKKKYGVNYYDYTRKKHLAEYGGINGVSARCNFSFNEVENLDAYQFPDGIDYVLDDDFSRALRKSEEINILGIYFKILIFLPKFMFFQLKYYSKKHIIK
jgi:hypothetical protein